MAAKGKSQIRTVIGQAWVTCLLGIAYTRQGRAAVIGQLGPGAGCGGSLPQNHMVGVMGDRSPPEGGADVGG